METNYIDHRQNKFLFNNKGWEYLLDPFKRVFRVPSYCWMIEMCIIWGNVVLMSEIFIYRRDSTMSPNSMRTESQILLLQLKFRPNGVLWWVLLTWFLQTSDILKYLNQIEKNLLTKFQQNGWITMTRFSLIIHN